jgi:ketosteroid isomerase-like protein
MKKKLNFRRFLSICITIIGCAFIIASCNSPKKDTKETFDMAAAKKGIEEQNLIFTEAMNKSDSVTAANCYTTDAKFMQPNAKATAGRNNIMHVMSAFMKSGMPKFSLNTLEVWGNNELLISEDEWKFSDKNGKEVDRGKSLVVWKMEDGKWKMFRDCYNSDMPMPK